MESCVEQEADGSRAFGDKGVWRRRLKSGHALVQPSFQNLGWMRPRTRTVPGDKSIFEAPAESRVWPCPEQQRSLG